MAREKSMSPEKVKKTSVTVKKVSTVERKGSLFGGSQTIAFCFLSLFIT